MASSDTCEWSQCKLRTRHWQRGKCVTCHSVRQMKSVKLEKIYLRLCCTRLANIKQSHQEQSSLIASPKRDIRNARCSTSRAAQMCQYWAANRAMTFFSKRVYASHTMQRSSITNEETKQNYKDALIIIIIYKIYIAPYITCKKVTLRRL